MNFVDSLSLFHVDAKEIPCLTGKGAPTAKTEGAPGVLYMDTDTGALYKCRAADPVNEAYTWEEAVRSDSSQNAELNQTVKEHSALLSNAYDSVNLDGKVNLLDGEIMLSGCLYSSLVAESTDYNLYVNVPVEAGKTYIVEPKARQIKVTDIETETTVGSRAPSILQSETAAPVTALAATATGFAQITFYSSDDPAGYRFYQEGNEEAEIRMSDIVTFSEKQKETVKALAVDAASVLSGKKWAVFGDSFTYGGYGSADGFAESEYKFQSGKYAGKNITYPYIIAERNNMEVLEYFASGRTLAYPEDGSFANSITNPDSNAYYQNIPEDVDYITIYLGINDSHHESGTSGTDGEDVTGVIPLGTIDDADASTFCGAWNVVLPWLMVNRPSAHIGIIASNGCDRVAYRTATIAAAKKWGIPYIDLNGDERCPAMIRTKNPDISATARDVLLQKWRVSESNTHPNTAAHYFQSTFIEEWMRTL